METSELLKKVRHIEIKTRGLSRNIFAGQYHSAFKGRGMAFSEVREYQYGDDVRDIDWNVTARYNKPYVKVFEEERELMMAEVAATIAFSAIQNNDKIGMIFFSDKIEKFIPPKKGRKHILYIIRELIDFQPESTGTNISLALEYMTNAIKKRCTTFLISDFVDGNDYKNALSIANRRHDLVAIQVYDRRETQLPDVGLIKLQDSERGCEQWVDSSSANVRNRYAAWWNSRQERMLATLRKSRVDLATIATNDDFVVALMTLFKRRG